nr:unnamed protein product [Digitaria exilis]
MPLLGLPSGFCPLPRNGRSSTVAGFIMVSPTWSVEVHGHHMETTCELAALNGISSFCAQNQDLVEHQLLGLFPPTQPDDAHWMRRYLSSPLRMAENPVAAAALMMRWIRAYHRLQALMTCFLGHDASGSNANQQGLEGQQQPPPPPPPQQPPTW